MPMQLIVGLLFCGVLNTLVALSFPPIQWWVIGATWLTPLALVALAMAYDFWKNLLKRWSLPRKKET